MAAHYIPAKQWKSGPKRKSVSQRIAERKKPKQKFVKRVRVEAKEDKR
jgi:hypothetical protein